MDTEQQAIENTQQQLPANNSGTAQEISPKSRDIVKCCGLKFGSA